MVRIKYKPLYCGWMRVGISITVTLSSFTATIITTNNKTKKKNDPQWRRKKKAFGESEQKNKKMSFFSFRVEAESIDHLSSSMTIPATASSLHFFIFSVCKKKKRAKSSPFLLGVVICVSSRRISRIQCQTRSLIAYGIYTVRRLNNESFLMLMRARSPLRALWYMWIIYHLISMLLIIFAFRFKCLKLTRTHFGC